MCKKNIEYSVECVHHATRRLICKEGRTTSVKMATLIAEGFVHRMRGRECSLRIRNLETDNKAKTYYKETFTSNWE